MTNTISVFRKQEALIFLIDRKVLLLQKLSGFFSNVTFGGFMGGGTSAY